MARILVVDDSSTVRTLLKHVLGPDGHEVDEAVDGVDALEKLARGGADLLIVDLNMPQMDGMELIRTLREDPQWKDLPVIMLTTQSDDSSRRKALSAGANLYMVKPMPREMILYKVRSLLGGGPPDG